jgi:D-alanyl-D-alanine carboxypeptidase
MPKKFLTSLGIILLLIVGGIGVRTFFVRSDKKELVTTSATQSSPTPVPPPTPVFDKKQFSTTDPSSIWIVVNKKHSLVPSSYAPSDLVIPNVPLRVPGNESMQLRKITATALETMFTAAKAQDVNLKLSSGYRSYQYQVSLYGSYVKGSSITEADKTSARPGYSEHQTGLAADIEPLSEKCDIDACFATTPEGIWLAANAYKYGFIIRYTEDKVAITGYNYEPWHVRYVGIDLAQELHTEKVATLEEFFTITSGDYSS